MKMKFKYDAQTLDDLKGIILESAFNKLMYTVQSSDLLNILEKKLTVSYSLELCQN